jgi:hypothetical protein
MSIPIYASTSPNGPYKEGPEKSHRPSPWGATIHPGEILLATETASW